MYGTVIDTTNGFKTANGCAKLCHGIVECRFWKIYFPVEIDPNAPGVVGQCIQFGEHPRPHLVDKVGWISGVSGCTQ